MSVAQKSAPDRPPHSRYDQQEFNDAYFSESDDESEVKQHRLSVAQKSAPNGPPHSRHTPEVRRQYNVGDDHSDDGVEISMDTVEDSVVIDSSAAAAASASCSTGSKRKRNEPPLPRDFCLPQNYHPSILKGIKEA